MIGGLTFMGKQGLAASASTLASAVTAATTNPVMNCTSNFGNLYDGSVGASALATAIASLKLTLNNNLRAPNGLGQKASINIGYGSVVVTGTFEAYFEDQTLYNKFINHTSSMLSWRCTDANGKIYIFTLPLLYYPDGNIGGPGQNADVTVPLNFQAIADPTSGCTMSLDAF